MRRRRSIVGFVRTVHLISNSKDNGFRRLPKGKVRYLFGDRNVLECSGMGTWGRWIKTLKLWMLTHAEGDSDKSGVTGRMSTQTWDPGITDDTGDGPYGKGFYSEGSSIHFVGGRGSGC